MATAAAVSKPHVWDINDLYKVCVYNVCPQNTDSNVVLDCYVTERLHIVGFMSERRSAVLNVQFPVPSFGQTHSVDMLRETFRRALKEFVNCDKNEIAVSIDNLRTWSKEKFCQVLLSEFLEYARSSSRRQSGRVTLALCATESQDFKKACEACRQLEVNAATQSGQNFGTNTRMKQMKTRKSESRSPAAQQRREVNTFPIPKGYTAELVQLYCQDTIKYLQDSGCEVDFKDDKMILKSPDDISEKMNAKMHDELKKVEKAFPVKEFIDLSQSDCNTSDLRRFLDEIKFGFNVECFLDTSKKKVAVFGKDLKELAGVKDKIQFFLHDRKRNETEDSRDVQQRSSAGGSSCGSRQRTSLSNSSQVKPVVAVFETKEKITVKVYSANILSVPVDCIVNAANVNLEHGSGIAKEVASSAGKELTKECHEILIKHGKLKVGEACSTSSGRLEYKCVVHTVGPCWNDYRPYTQTDVEKCELDLYHAVLNSLREAEKKKMQTIAVSSISSGKYGCPLDLCSVQYARAVTDYSKLTRHPLKEIHFVDTNMEMVKTMQETFYSMIPDEKVPKFYNKLAYMKSLSSEASVPGTNTRLKQMKTWKSESRSQAAQQSRTVNTIPIPIGYTSELVQLYCQETIKYLQDSACEVDFKDDKMILKSPDDISEKMTAKMQYELKKVEKAFPVKELIDLPQSDSNTSDFRRYLEDIKSALNVGSSCGSRQRKSLLNSSQVKPVVAVFETKEKITVKVYSANILSVQVDCIVNAANSKLEHGGEIGKEIASSAGKELTEECHEILKKHGELKVGEACSTSSGRLEYKCVVHTVGPFWNDYRPFTQTDVEKCEMDLYHAVLNSLREAEKKNMQTIAVSSISSGKYGCPLDLCSVQYARAVTDYSKLTRHPLKEIHFVDTNMEMVKIMQETFYSMIPDEKVPKFYNNLAYMTSLGSEDSVPGKRVFKETNDSGRQKDSRKDQKKSGHSSPSFRGSDLTAYPYWCQDYLPGQKQKMFACFLGPYQKLYVYSTDILSMTGIDIIVCSNIPDGNTKGKLANAILSKGGVAYKRGKEEAFKKKATVGSIVACPAGNLRFKWVVHAILFNKKDIKDEKEREWNVKSIFQDIFSMLRKKGCDSMALPLIGTADPVYYAERCIDGLLDFCSFNKDYPFTIHIVHNEEEKTEIVQETVKRAVRNAPLLPQQNQYKPEKKPLTDQPKRPLFQYSYHENHGSSHGRNNSKRYEMHNFTKTKHDEHPKVGKMYTIENTDNSVSNPRVSENGSEKADVTETQHIVENFQESDVSGSDTDENEKFCNTTNQNEASHAEIREGNLPIYNVDDSDDQPSNDEGKTEISEEEKEGDSDQEGLETEVNEQIVDEEEEEHEDEKETCVICMDEITDPRALPCEHVFCEDSIEAHFTYKEVYPTCGKVCGIITGDQPYGTMDVYTNEKASCAGFGSFGRIEITYNFPDGKQGPDHPSPGTSYKGITRKAYLPNNSRGKQICAMLRVAFERKLVFTIGRSRTTGTDGVITWNNINHKTDPRPKSWFGYPDPSYLDRVTEDLEIKGVTINDIPALSVMKSRHR